MDCGLWIAARLPSNLAAAIHENIRDLVNCGGAAKGDDAPQLERFYTVPNYFCDKTWLDKVIKLEQVSSSIHSLFTVPRIKVASYLGRMSVSALSQHPDKYILIKLSFLFFNKKITKWWSKPTRHLFVSGKKEQIAIYFPFLSSLYCIEFIWSQYDGGNFDKEQLAKVPSKT